MNDSDPGFNPQNYNATQFQFNNQGFNSSSALQMRLNPESIVQNFEAYLRGKDMRLVEVDGVQKWVDILDGKGQAIVNDAGFQAIMRWFTLVMNNQVIQGNFLDEGYFGDYMYNLRLDVAEDLLVNRQHYGIEIRNINALIAGFMNCAYLLLTRPLFNKERDGMNNTVKVVENSQTLPPRGMMSNIPFFGGGRSR